MEVRRSVFIRGPLAYIRVYTKTNNRTLKLTVTNFIRMTLIRCRTSCYGALGRGHPR